MLKYSHMNSLIKNIDAAKLRGRGGASFPTAKKWQIFLETKADKKYIIVNASEGDPQMSKDGYLLKNHLDDVVNGLKISLKFFKGSEAFFYLKKDYYEKHKSRIIRLTKDLPVKIFKKPGEYLAGEETSILEAIEGRRPEPRHKPPYPCACGLFNKPTLVNNVETLYAVSRISQGKYKNERLYCLSGDLKNKGVFELKDGLTIKEILEQTKNLPKNNDYFIQMGGVLGEFLLPKEIDRPLLGLASVVVYDKKITNPILLAQKILKFSMYQNCDKCTPCREGVFRLREEFLKNERNKKILNDIFQVLEDTTLCPLGMLAGNSINSLLTKIINGKD